MENNKINFLNEILVILNNMQDWDRGKLLNKSDDFKVIMWDNDRYSFLWEVWPSISMLDWSDKIWESAEEERLLKIKWIEDKLIELN